MTLEFDFTDYLKLTKPTEKQIFDWKDNLSTINNNTSGLQIVMEATHAGYLNGNNKIYIPSRMADGVSTFRTGNKTTKLLKHHKIDEDPVGKILAAQFVPTVPEELKDNQDVRNLMYSGIPIETQIKSIRKLWSQGIFHQDGWKGLGYIQLIGMVTDKLTVEQILDGRFDAVSTNFISPGSVHCLACASNWLGDEPCEHEIGQICESEDGIKIPALPIAGLHNYIETSFINVESDRLVTIEIMDKKDTNNNKTFFLSDSWKEEDDNFNKPTFEFKDFKEDDMAKKTVKPTLSDAEQKVLDIVKVLRTEMNEDTLKDYATKIAALRQEDDSFPYQVEANLDEKTIVQYALEDLETADQKVDADAVYADFEKELDKLKLSDAKLSSEGLTGLPDSAFCGPDRSFPVSDTVHADAAKIVIGSYAGPGNKAQIIASINRKAESLGAQDGVSKSQENADKQDGNQKPSTEDTIKEMKDSDLRTLYMTAEVELVKRGQKMAFECKECAIHKDKVKQANEDMVSAQGKTTKMENTLIILREELQRSYADYASQVNVTVEANAALHTEKVESLALIGVLNKKYDSIDNARNEIKDKSIVKLETMIKDGFDLDAVALKLNDGMANVPNGDTVADPTANTDGDNTSLTKGLSAPALGAIENIKDFISENKISDAKNIYDTMKTLKLFPDELSFESFSVKESLSK